MSHDPVKAKPHAPEHVPFYARRSWAISAYVAVIMVGLAMLGVGLTTARSSYAETYWVCLVPVFGLLCIVTAWRRSGPGNPVDRRAVIRQVLHWIGIGVAVGMDFYIRQTGEETAVATGLNALMVLALGCYLAGIHLEKLFVLVALLLTVTLILVVKADQYLWLVFVIGAVTIVFILAMHWLLAARHIHLKAPATPPPSAPSAS